VAAVVLYHAGVPGITGGYVGVDVFFVISGYLITRLLVAEHERTGALSISAFYARRVKRILPAATLVIVATVLAAYALLGYVFGNSVANDGRWASVFAANIHFAIAGNQYFVRQGPISPLLHMWSLGVEEQFYIVWPTVIIIVGLVGSRTRLRHRLAATLVAAVGASFAWSIIQTRTNAPWAYYSPLTRAWELALGGLVAVAYPLIRRFSRRVVAPLGWLGLCAILASCFVFDPSTPYPGSAAALPVVGTVLIITAGSVADGLGVERVLRQRPIQWLGKRSYSLYLWHWPLLVIPAEHAGTSLSLGENLLLVAAASLAAAATYRLVENPVRRSKLLSRRVGLTLLIGFLLIAVGFSGASDLTGDHPRSDGAGL
jgi:peptidoglycan/LPS O-acetylase OafA/YrhL